MSRVGPPALIVGLMLAASACKIMPENPYRTAAEQGNLNAQYLLGRMYERGQGVAKDDVLAYVWLSAAAEQGSAEAAHGMDSAAGQADARAAGRGPDARQRTAREGVAGRAVDPAPWAASGRAGPPGP